MGRLRLPKGPPKRGGKIDHPDLFVWAWAKAIPPTLDAFLGDVSAVSVRAVPALFLAYLGIWLALSEDSTQRPVLGLATAVTLSCATLALWTRARRSKMRPSIAIAWHSVAVCGAGLMTLLVVASGLYQDRVRSSAREEAAAKTSRDEQAAQAATAEAQRQAARASEAAARALAAKDEAAKEAERAGARVAQAECQSARQDAIDKATQAYVSARRGAEDCRARYNEQLIPLKQESEYCKAPFAGLGSARGQLSEAKAKTCGDISTGSIDKPKQ